MLRFALCAVFSSQFVWIFLIGNQVSLMIGFKGQHRGQNTMHPPENAMKTELETASVSVVSDILFELI